MKTNYPTYNELGKLFRELDFMIIKLPRQLKYFAKVKMQTSDTQVPLDVTRQENVEVIILHWQKNAVLKYYFH